MVKKGAKIGARGFNGRNPMMNACECGNLDIVKFFISKGVDIDTKDKAGKTPLIISLENKKRNVTVWLIENNADVKAKEDETKKSALICAAQNGDKEIYDMLVQKGASQNAKDKSGKNAKDYLKENSQA